MGGKRGDRSIHAQVRRLRVLTTRRGRWIRLGIVLQTPLQMVEIYEP